MAKKAKHHAKARASLPTRKPKATGKRGIGPREFDGDLAAQDAARQAKDAEPEKLVTPDNPPKARQARLPQMEDPAIEELEAAAEEYVDIRDQRMALTPEENRLKTELLGLMKKHGKASYVHDGFDIKVIVEKEKVRVRIHKEAEQEEAQAASAD